jgi:two-component system chemotaxis response regulator CheB
MQDIEAGKRTIAEQVIPKIKQFARPVGRARPIVDAAAAAHAAGRDASRWRRIDVVAMAVSTGGPQALAQLLPAFVPGCPVPVLIVQHMPPMFTRHLAARLSSEFGLPACEAQEGRELQPGEVYLAPGGRHMRVEQADGRMRLCLNDDPAENGCRPSADVLFRSVAAAYGAAALTVVLTGMGQDGMRGCRQLREAGGRILVQDQQSSVVWGMPGQVVRAGLADQILPLDKIGAEITRCLRRHRGSDAE